MAAMMNDLPPSSGTNGVSRSYPGPNGVATQIKALADLTTRLCDGGACLIVWQGRGDAGTIRSATDSRSASSLDSLLAAVERDPRYDANVGVLRFGHNEFAAARGPRALAAAASCAAVTISCPLDPEYAAFSGSEPAPAPNSKSATTENGVATIGVNGGASAHGINGDQVAFSRKSTLRVTIILATPETTGSSDSPSLLAIAEITANAVLAIVRTNMSNASRDFWRKRSAESAERLTRSRLESSAVSSDRARIDRAVAALEKLHRRNRFANLASHFAKLGPFDAWLISMPRSDTPDWSASPNVVPPASALDSAASLVQARPDAASANPIGVTAARQHASQVRSHTTAEGARPGALAERADSVRPSALAECFQRQTTLMRSTPPASSALYNEDLAFGRFASYVCVPLEYGAIALAALTTPDAAAIVRVEALAARVNPLIAQWLLEAENDRLRRLVRNLGLRMFGAIDTERARIARDLHDHQAQLLAAARIGIEAGPGAARGIFKQLEDALRMRVRELKPPTLGRSTLTEGLRDELRRLADVGIKGRLTHPDKVNDITRPVQQVCYQVAREALANVLRHAAASRVEISIQKHDGLVLLSILDNGKGIGNTTGRGGIGLTGLGERLELMGGRLRIESHAGSTRLVAEIPESS